MSPKARALELADRVKSWMRDISFPFWAERAANPDGGFYERLDLAGFGISGEPSRVRLQARMAFTFSLAADLGWDRERAKALTERALRVLADDCMRPDGLYGRTVIPRVGLIDDTADCYDTAFALLAFASAYRVFELDEALGMGTRLCMAIDKYLKRPACEGGYRECLPEPELREQNPHMHLTEASLAWFEATGDLEALERARATILFVQQHFFDPATGMLMEYPVGSQVDNRVEVGHIFEWVWILGRLRDLSGSASESFSNALHEGGIRLIEGLDYVPLSQKADGTVLEAIQRTWGPTEKLKGHIAHWRGNPSDELAITIIETAERMLADHVEGAVRGAWIDVIEPNRTPKINDITPATGYHLFLALQEFNAFTNEFESAEPRR